MRCDLKLFNFMLRFIQESMCFSSYPNEFLADGSIFLDIVKINRKTSTGIEQQSFQELEHKRTVAIDGRHL